VLQAIDLDRGCFACALGGPDRMTLYMIAMEWKGPAGMFATPPTDQVLVNACAGVRCWMALKNGVISAT
jgi:hypothetical protein